MVVCVRYVLYNKKIQYMDYSVMILKAGFRNQSKDYDKIRPQEAINK